MGMDTENIVTAQVFSETEKQLWRKAQVVQIIQIQKELAKLSVFNQPIKFDELNDVDLTEELDAHREQLKTRQRFLGIGAENKIVALYADGGVIFKNPSTVGGTWAFCGVNAADQRVLEKYGAVPATPNRPITNNHTEQIAITLALEAMPDGWSGTVYLDSQIALGRVFKNWSERNLPRNISMRSKAAVARIGQIETVLLQGHPTKADLACGIGKKRGLPVSEHNVWADKSCHKAAEEFLEKLEIV